MEHIQPLFDRILVVPDAPQEKTAGGIIIPDTAQEKPKRGRVLAVGPGKSGQAMTVQPGDIVLFGKYVGSEIELETGSHALIMREEEAIAIITNK